MDQSIPKSETVEGRFWAKVNMLGDCWVWTSATIPRGYGVFNLGTGAAYRNILAHRLSWEWTYGTIPKGIQIDHRCNNRLCVRPDHLRLATGKQNEENRTGANKNSKSGVRGVYWHQGRWRACVWHNRKRFDAGAFDSLDDAEAAVIAKRNELFTHNDRDREVV